MGNQKKYRGITSFLTIEEEDQLEEDLKTIESAFKRTWNGFKSLFDRITGRAQKRRIQELEQQVETIIQRHEWLEGRHSALESVQRSNYDYLDKKMTNDRLAMYKLVIPPEELKQIAHDYDPSYNPRTQKTAPLRQFTFNGKQRKSDYDSTNAEPQVVKTPEIKTKERTKEYCLER